MRFDFCTLTFRSRLSAHSDEVAEFGELDAIPVRSHHLVQLKKHKDGVMHEATNSELKEHHKRPQAVPRRIE